MANENVAATELLSTLGFSTRTIKSGPAEIIKALNELGIKPVETKVCGRGVSFFVSRSDFDAAITRKKTSSVDNSRGSAIYRDMRSLARAILDLYDLLEETPDPRNSIYRIAEKTHPYVETVSEPEVNF